MLTKVLRSQQKLTSKIAKLEANQNSSQGSAIRCAGGNDRCHAKAPPQTHDSIPNWSEDGCPRCYDAGGEFGHFRRSCRARNDWHSCATPTLFSATAGKLGSAASGSPARPHIKITVSVYSMFALLDTGREDVANYV